MIKKYTKPEIIDLEFRNATGNCGSGSSPATTCAANGGSALTNCEEGGSARGNCSDGDAVTNWDCGPTGNAATISCVTGPEK
jgi:hypothetical protein